MLDMYLAPHVNTLYSQIRNRALVQVSRVNVFVVPPSSQIVFLRTVSVRAVVFLPTQGRVVRKPVNANPGLRVKRGINFSQCMKVLSIAYVLCTCSLRLLMLKTEGQNI